MTTEQRAMLSALVEKTPHMRVSTLKAKIAAQIKVNELRDEIGYKPRPVAETMRSVPVEGLTEGLL